MDDKRFQNEVRRTQALTAESRSREAKASYDRTTAQRKRYHEVLASALPAEHLAKVPVTMPSFMQQVHEDWSPPKRRELARTSAPFEFDWKETTPAGLDLTWYGPDRATGRLGARLLSQAQGDRQALSSVGISYYASQSRDMLVSANFVIPRVYLDTGGMGPSSATARLSLGISAFEGQDVKIATMSEEYLSGDSMNVMPGFPHFWAKEATDGTAWRALPVSLQAGRLYTFYVECIQFVGTWGPAGAQVDASDLVVSSIEVKLPAGT